MLNNTPKTSVPHNILCPADNCDYVARSVRGISTHWMHKHNGPCPLTQEQKICIGCNAAFWVSKAMLAHRPMDYCSRECWARSVAQRYVVVCEGCGESFECKDGYAAKHQKYCSRECQWKSLTGRSVSRRTVTCEHCGTTFSDIAYRLERGRRYCSHECASAAKDIGATSIQDKFRDAEHYLGWRDMIFHRDNYKCVRCGSGGELNAHHLTPVAQIVREIASSGIVPQEHPLFCDINNGETLCVTCHGAEHKKPHGRDDGAKTSWT